VREEASSFVDPKSRPIWKWAVALVLIALAGLAVYRVLGSPQKQVQRRGGQRPDVPVQVRPVVRKPIAYSFRATADIVPLMEVELFPKVSGYLERINVRIGDEVRPGQVIAQIDPSDFFHKVKEIEAKLAQAKAQLSELEAGARPEELREAEEAVKQARSRFDNARLQRERVEALFKRQVISKKEMDLADMEYNVSQAQLAASEQRLLLVKEGARREVREASQAKVKEIEALLAQERIKLGQTSIVAPFRGQISKRYVDVGALVSPSTPLVTLVHTDTVKVIAPILEKDIPRVRVGMKAKIEAQAFPGEVFEGRIARVNSALDQATRTLQAEIEIANPGHRLKPGMFVRLEIVLAEKPDALVVPKDAVMEEGTARWVFVVTGNQAVRRSVRTGLEHYPEIEILEGVAEGERVVIKGQESIRNGLAVRVVEGG
jgi:HlyD family secretion protein